MGGNAFWNFRRLGGVKTWEPSVVGYGYFLELPNTWKYFTLDWKDSLCWKDCYHKKKTKVNITRSKNGRLTNNFKMFEEMLLQWLNACIIIKYAPYQSIQEKEKLVPKCWIEYWIRTRSMSHPLWLTLVLLVPSLSLKTQFFILRNISSVEVVTSTV